MVKSCHQFKGETSPMRQLLDDCGRDATKEEAASLNCTVQMPNAGSGVKIVPKSAFFMSCGVRCVSCWMIVVAAPAKRGEGLPRLCDSTPTQRRTTYGDKRYALSSALWNIIFYNSGAHKKW